MVYFHNKNPNLGIFLRVFEWKMLVYAMAIWYILRSIGIFSGHLVHIFYSHLVNFVIIWYIFLLFGLFCQEKSGNPAGTALQLLTTDLLFSLFK
jgi:hypothetical protein